MANYDIPQYPTKRLRYFNNQFLKDQDFIDDDSSQIAHERALLRSLCVAGVCEGMVVTYPAANKPPSVSAGVAIDRNGSMIVVDQPTDGLANPTALADGDYFVHISFLESEDDKATGQGAPDYTRWKQTPVINATAKATALPDGAVVLGSCTVLNKAFVGSGTTIGRQYSGLRLPGPNKTATATLRNNGAADDLAVLGGSLTIRRDVAGQLGPTLTLLNGGGGGGAGGAIDFDGYDPGTNGPALRVRSLDDGSFSGHLTFATKQPGAATNGLVERLRLTSDGLLRFSNDAPKDKLVIYDNGATDRYGLGLNGGNINLFCPPAARFSLRQSSSSGAEVFSVTGAGAATFFGPITPKVGNDGNSGIQFPINPGGGGGDEAFLRYYATAGETTKLMLGINNDPDDTIGLWQAGAERFTVSAGNVGIGTQAPSHILHVRTADAVGLFESTTTQAFLRFATSEGMANRVEFCNRPGGRAAIWVGAAGDAFNVTKDGRVTVSKASGGVGDLTVENFLRFPNEAPKDKIVIWEGSATDRYGLGLNGGNINLFCPVGAHLSLRQNSSAGAEVFTVHGTSGDVGINGKHAFRANDTWLRLNQDGAFTSGVHTPHKFAPMSLNVGGAGPQSWDTDPGAGNAWMTGKLGVLGYSPTGGGNFPAGWGGGVHTWDVVAEATVGYSNLTKWSSIHAKTEIRELSDALATLDQLSPVVYERTGKSHAGLVAEEVREVFPHGAEANPEDFFAVGIQPDALLALTIAAVQELSARVRELSAAARGEAIDVDQLIASPHDVATGATVASRYTAAEAPRPGASPTIEILREGIKDSQRYVTARFRAPHTDGGSRQVVRTIRIPDAGSRDQCLETEFDAWHRRVIG